LIETRNAWPRPKGSLFRCERKQWSGGSRIPSLA
jgi:hypothetical protein